jgi:hypothetical protein
VAARSEDEEEDVWGAPPVRAKLRRAAGGA